MAGKKTGGGAKAARTGRGGPGEKAGATPLPQFDGRSFLSSVGMGRTSTAYQTKQIVYRQGDPADAVHYIQAGKVRLTVVSEQGKEGVIAMLGAGEFFGEGCIAMQPLRMASAATMVKSTIVRIEKAAMLRVLHEQPHVGDVHVVPVVAQHSDRGGPGRPAVQFERTQARQAAAAPRQLRQGRQDGIGHSIDQPGCSGGESRYYTVADQLLHEQVPEARLHRI